MKTFLRWFLRVFLFLVVSFNSHALFVAGLSATGNPFTFNFDENGNGQIDPRDGSGFTNNPGFLAPDPTQAGNPLVLTFMVNINGPVNNGDVRVWEDFFDGTLSDVMRFTDAQGNLGGTSADRMIFYSDLPEVGEVASLADTGIPAVLFAQEDFGGAVEEGTEGNNGFTFAPFNDNSNVYNGISDVPEPSTVTLGVLGVGLLVSFRRAKKA